jgi:hypothetical protein
MALTVSHGSWKGWDTVYHLTNGEVELRITADVGPRVLEYRFVDGDNVLNVVEDEAGRTGDDEFNIYGGHRFWHAPEQFPRTYFPDNAPVTVEQDANTLQIAPPEEASNSVQKVVEVTLAETGSSVELRHTLSNTGPWPIEVAPWSLTVMASGGRAIIPLPPRGSHPEDLLPTHNLTLWAYTDFSDPRWTFGYKYILLQQQGGDVLPQKIGISLTPGWLAYALNGQLFVKQFDYTPGPYPDMNSSAEVFTNSWMTELESLGHLRMMQPGTSVTHIESWTLHFAVPVPQNDADVDANILPLIATD